MMKRSKRKIRWENVRLLVAALVLAVVTFTALAYVNTHSLRLGRVASVCGSMVTFDVNGQLYVIQDDSTGLSKGDHVRILFDDNGAGPEDDEIVKVFKAW